jgi:hypothetical protein
LCWIIGDAERFHCGKQARANWRNIPITLKTPHKKPDFDSYRLPTTN